MWVRNFKYSNRGAQTEWLLTQGQLTRSNALGFSRKTKNTKSTKSTKSNSATVQHTKPTPQLDHGQLDFGTALLLSREAKRRGASAVVRGVPLQSWAEEEVPSHAMGVILLSSSTKDRSRRRNNNNSNNNNPTGPRATDWTRLRPDSECSEVCRTVIAHSRVKGRGMRVVCPWIIEIRIWDMIKHLCFDHLGGYIMAEGLHLGSDVSQEGIAGPPTEEHDGVDWDAIHIHCHC